MRVFLFRHGETDHNRNRMTLGREDIALNDTGHRQGQAIAAAFAGAKFSAIYASPLRRARDTAAPVAERLGLVVTADEGLIEMDVGETGSLSGEELRARYGDFLAAWTGADAADLQLPGGGESLRQVQERAWAAIERIAGEHHDADVAVFTHNFVALTLLCRALSLDLRSFRRVRQDLAALSVIVLTETTVGLERMNDRCHLAGL